MEKPIPTYDYVSFNADLVNACEEYIEYLDTAEDPNKEDYDYAHLIFEAALQAVYGKDVWIFVSEKLDG